MKWFRFYSEALHDPKVQQLRPELFKFWVNCLCLANEQADRGSLPSIDELAFILRMKRPVVERFCNELVVAQLLHRRLGDGSVTGHCDVTDRSVTGHCDVTIGFMIHQWSARQPSSDDIASRVKRYRERTSGVALEPKVTLHETGMGRTCNDPDLDSDSERDKEREKSPLSSPLGGTETTTREAGGPPAPEKPKAARARSPRPMGPPAFPAEDSPLRIDGGPFEMSREQAEEIWWELWRAFGVKSICLGFYAHQRYHSFETWKAAIQKAIRAGSKVRKIGYVEVIAEDLPAVAREQMAWGPRETPAERKRREREEKWLLFEGGDNGEAR